MSRRIALVTCSDHPDLTEDDRLLVPELDRLGIRGVPVVWDAPVEPWERFDALVIRSTWDYVRRADEFLTWLDERAAGAPRLINSADVLRWNFDKRYLEELERAGVPIVPTIHVPRGEDADVAALARARGWDDVVVKPSVSGSAFRTVRTQAAQAHAHDALVRDILRDSGLLIQPYMPEVAEVGEVSLLFFGGELSHAVRKRPRAGDFRVQSELGGTVQAFVPDRALVTQARACIAAAPSLPTYARVDGIVRADRFRLMELEVLEPAMFLALAPGAPARFARAIAARLAAPPLDAG